MAEAGHVLDLLDAGAVSELTPLFAPRLEGWDADSWIRDWMAGLDSLLGSPLGCDRDPGLVNAYAI